MSDIEKPVQRVKIEDAMKEISGLLLDSIWNYQVLPAKDKLVAHLFGQKAGTDTLARLAKADPEMDAAYENV